MSRRRYVTQKFAANYFGVTERTIRNWISRGHITAYKLPGGTIRLDLDEVEKQGISVIPAIRRTDKAGVR